MDYVPVSCDLHDRLEEMAVRRTHSRFQVLDRTGTPREFKGVVVDVFSRSGAEYLRMEDGREVRLDRLCSIDGQEIKPPRRSERGEAA